MSSMNLVNIELEMEKNPPCSALWCKLSITASHNGRLIGIHSSGSCEPEAFRDHLAYLIRHALAKL